MGISGVRLCGPLGVPRVYVVCSLQPMWWIQGVMPALGLVRTTVYGPFHCGAKELCFQSLTTPNPWVQIHESVPQGGIAPFLVQTQLPDLLPYQAVPSAVKSHLPLSEANLLTPVLLQEGASHTQFPTANSLGTVGSS